MVNWMPTENVCGYAFTVLEWRSTASLGLSRSIHPTERNKHNPVESRPLYAILAYYLSDTREYICIIVKSTTLIGDVLKRGFING
jgi:hypothetical protein